VTEIEAVLKAVQVAPHQRREMVRCEACGHGTNWWDRLWAWIRTTGVAGVDVAYCAGGKPVSQPVGMIQAAMTGNSEVQFVCAGVLEEHLHIRCRCCGSGWLMQCKRRRDHNAA
jgi:hypothetical protein